MRLKFVDVKKIKNKYKQCKYQHLKKIYAKNLSRQPANCKYNKEIRLPNRTRLNICGFNFDDSYDVDLCYKSDHAKDCNAFCSIKSKEELYLNFLDELKDDQIRATKFKDINILYWMCMESKNRLDSIFDKISWYSKVFLFLKKLW